MLCSTRIGSGLTAMVALACLWLAPLRADEWTQWRGDARNGVARVSPPLLGELPAEGLQPLWKSENIPSGNNGGWGSPVIANGKVYLFAHYKSQRGEGSLPPKKYPYLPEDKRTGMSAEEFAEYEVNRRNEDEERANFYKFTEVVYCLDVDTGKTVWKDERDSVYTRFLQSGSPAVADGKLYILGAGRMARCLDAETGSLVWEKRLPGDFRDEFMMSSFVVVDGLAVVLCGHLFALDASTGEIVWQGDERQTRGTHTSPVVWRHGGEAFIIANVASKYTMCCEARTGKELWRVESEANQSTPVVAGDLLLTYGGSRRAGLRCYRMARDGAEEVWTYRRLADKGSSPLIWGDHVYVQGEKRLGCVELASGDEAWSAMLDLARPQYTSLVAADGKVFYACDGVLWFAADPHDYRELVAAKVNKQGLIASEQKHRELLDLDNVENQENGLEKSLRIWQSEVGNQGPLPCASPALVGGKLFVRLRDCLACYDLAAQQKLAEQE